MKIPKFIISSKVVKTFEKIYRKNEIENRIFEYYAGKIKLSVLILITGIALFIVLLAIENSGYTTLIDEIERNDYIKGKKPVSLEWSFDSTFSPEKTRRIDYAVNERMYTYEELMAIKDTFFEELCSTILANNKSFDCINEDLRFVSKLEGYPFSISYMTDKPLVLSSKGIIDDTKISVEGEIITICIDIKYDEFYEKEFLPVCIYSKEKTKEEIVDEAVIAEIKASDENTRFEKHFILPNEVYGEKIFFREIRENTSVYVLILAIIFSVAMFFAKDNEIKEMEAKRDKELNSDYPRMVNKFVLFYNAGFPVNVIWQKLCNGYEEDIEKNGTRKFVYEEMLISRQMINDGTNETDAYEDFGQRCGLPKYKLFSSLVCQAVVKGKSDMGEILKNEADKAFIEQKNNARKLSEEAGTKLLMPMFMMLAIVMIIVIMPAFRSFG